MPTITLDDLLNSLRAGDEGVSIEAKRSPEKIGSSILETISAFSNEPYGNGGHLLIGVSESQGLFRSWEITGVLNSDKLQSEIATQCRSAFNVPIRPEIRIEMADGLAVLVVYVPEAPLGQKPVYLKSRGLPRGAYRRIGSTNQVCTDDDLTALYQAGGVRSFDNTPISGSSLEDVDPAAIEAYRRGYSSVGPNQELLDFSDAELLHSVGAVSRVGNEEQLTVAGLVVFGSGVALRRLLPMARSDYIRVEGKEWVSDPDQRFQSIEKLGPLLLTLPSLVSQVLDDIPKTFNLQEGEIHRQDIPAIPRAVIREALVNALVHRSYRPSAGPVQIIRYSNRVEIRNPGHSLVPIETLGEPGSVPRNPTIATAMHDVGLAENKGTGIRAMRRAMERSNLTTPLFDSDRAEDRFSVTLLPHHLLSTSDWDWLGALQVKLTSDDAKALVVLREVGALDNATYRTLTGTDTLTASNRLRNLRDKGLIRLRGAGASSYYEPTDNLLGSPFDSPSIAPSDGGQNITSKHPKLGTEPPESSELPEDIAIEVGKLGAYGQEDRMRSVLLMLCAWRPQRASELAVILNRHKDYLQTKHLNPMLKSGQLQHLHPNKPTHPKQAYVSTDQAQSTTP